MGTDISLYTTAIRDLPKGESVRDAIINAVKILATQGTYASTLGGHPISDFVVYTYNESNPATNWQETEQNIKNMVDRINFGYTQAEQPTVVHQTMLGPTGSFNSQDTDPESTGVYSFNKLAKCKKDIRDAINEAWRNTPSSGTHGSEEYLVLSSDPFEDYPNFVSLIGVGEGFTNSVSTLNVTENGVYNAPSGTGYDKVNVNVQTQKIQAMPSEITADGTYAASNFGLDGFSFVTVRVPIVDPDDPSYDPQTAYDPAAWSQTTGQQVEAIFISKNIETGKDEEVGRQTLSYGGTPSLAASSFGRKEEFLPHEDDEKFSKWNPDLGPLTHNQAFIAEFEPIGSVDVTTGEIQDTWEEIALNLGDDRYPVGSWKVMNFGTVKRWIGPDRNTGEDVYFPIDIGRIVMIKVAGENEDDGTTSTWISEQAVDLGGLGLPVTCTKSMVEHAYDKETDDIFSFKDTDLCDFLNGRRHSLVHSIYEHLNPYVVGKMKSVDKKSIGVKVRASTNSTYGYKSLYYKGHEIDTYRCTFWVPSCDEIFHKKTLWTNAREKGYYRNRSSDIDGTGALAEAARKFVECDAPNYSDFFFGLNGTKEEYDYSDWFGYESGYKQGNAYRYPFRPSWTDQSKALSYWCTAPQTSNIGYRTNVEFWKNDCWYRFGTRDIAFADLSDTLDENEDIVTSTNTAQYIASGMTQDDTKLNYVKINVPILPMKFGWDNNGTSRYYKYPILANGWTSYRIYFNYQTFGSSSYNYYVRYGNYTNIGNVLYPAAYVSRDMVSKSDLSSIDGFNEDLSMKSILYYIGFSF